MRVGIGYDIHPFEPGRVLMLGGIKIEGSWGLRGHSDADVLLHAIGDALLGAAALGDLGDHFPDSDPKWKDAPSAVLLADILSKVKNEGFEPGNVDATIIAERPRIGPHRAAIRDRVGSLLGLHADAVNIKATTHEGLGALGKGQGIAVMAIVSLVEASA